MREHFAHCAELVREAERDRYLATLFAPAEKRDALLSLYAFDLEIARVRDLAREPMPAEIRLQWWHEVLAGEREGEAAANPVAAGLLDTLTHYRLPIGPLSELIDAHRFDVYDEPMPTFADFQAYAVKTAGTIFEYAVRVLTGDISAAVKALTVEAGQAQTIARVLAALPRHAARRQLYVPLEALDHYGANREDVFAMRASPEARAAFAELRLRGRRHLARIGDASAQIPENAQAAFLPLAPLRQWLLDMERENYDPFHPPEVPPWRRQWRIWRAARLLRRIGG